MTSAETGRLGEDLAVEHLEAEGFRVLERNFRFGREEIDVIAFEPTPKNDGGMIVFIEVKTRRGTGFGHPEEAVDEAKQAAIRRVAEAYLHERRLIPSPTRFDVVAVQLAGGTPEITHFRNAFGYFGI